MLYVSILGVYIDDASLVVRVYLCVGWVLARA